VHHSEVKTTAQSVVETKRSHVSIYLQLSFMVEIQQYKYIKFGYTREAMNIEYEKEKLVLQQMCGRGRQN